MELQDSNQIGCLLPTPQKKAKLCIWQNISKKSFGLQMSLDETEERFQWNTETIVALTLRLLFFKISFKS